MNRNERYFTPAKTVLLTGAGFTKPFGGFLASEMWAVILNQTEIRQYPRLRTGMLEELNYETLYDKVLTSNDYAPEEKRAFTDAIRGAYGRMHQNICQDDVRHRSSAAGVCSSFLVRFAGAERERGFFFTLNHDLFVERFYSSGDAFIGIPGLHNPRWFNGQLRSELGRDDRLRLPQQETVEQERARFWAKSAERFVYIKLHGSYGWETTRDGAECMAIGHAKTEIIKKEPLLRWYFSLFEDVLHAGDRNLVVIGYGFGDAHINELIASAIQNHGLRLYVVSPMLPRDFREMLLPLQAMGAGLAAEGYQARNALWRGLVGYYQASVTDFYRDEARDLTPLGRAFFNSLE